MDLTRSQLHIVVGTQEPVSSQPALGLRTGMIPVDVQAGGTLIAAWNGGFKAVHSHYGMMTDGVTWLDPIEGMGTVAVARDGQVEMGAWGQEISPTGDWLAWRQNNPPLIIKGVVNPEVTKTANTIRWGASRRSPGSDLALRNGYHPGAPLVDLRGRQLALGSHADGSAAGSDCYAAMQLDVNMTCEQYMTFTAKPQTTKLNGQPFTVPLTGHKLIDQMVAAPTMYLVPYSRDFFYLTYLPAH